MKIVQINATCGVGSTGKICVGISELLTSEGIENYILYSTVTNGYPHGISCSNKSYIRFQALKSKLFGNYGFNSKMATKKILTELDHIKPDIVHLHNLHGHDCDLESLFSYFRINKTKLIWTFHDCWAFTGYCPHFTMMRCDKWKTECSNCAQRREYSFFFDRSREMFNKKKRLFEGLDLTIVTPSKWLADIVKQSFLKDYPVKVINNGIDLAVFKPTESDFRKKHCLKKQKIVLGVAFDWGVRKGLDVFIELAQRLPAEYKIVLVGVDKKTEKKIPENVLCIYRTQNQKELAEIYSAADVFVNPTREENYPTVNMESLACGTPVVTFHTGGSPEILDGTCGSVVSCEDVDALFCSIVEKCESSAFFKDSCLHRATYFDANEKLMEYIYLYKEIFYERIATNPIRDSKIFY